MIGVRLDNLRYQSNTLLCLPEQSSITPGEISTGIIGAVLYDCLVGAKLDNQGHWSKNRQCLPELSLMTSGAKPNRDDQSGACRSLSWSKARQLRAQEQGSTVPTEVELNGPWSKVLYKDDRGSALIS